MYPLDDTIAAMASPPGGAARGILRLSGPRAIECLARFFQPAGKPLAVSGGSMFSPLPLGEGTKKRPTHVIAGSLQLPDFAAPLPCNAYVWPDVRSYTGQPVAEIHTLGSPPLLQLVLRWLCTEGARLAGPGEFTLRAFLAGRIDLTQAEAVLGVIDAHDPRQLEIALGQLAGGLAQPLHRLHDSLLDLLAHLEAGFDFADENLEFIARDELDRRLALAQEDVAIIRRQVDSRSELSHGVRAVLVGRPNAGKSSLFNALAGDRAAIVSEHPGTTRDYLVAELELDGVKCRLVDTAGTGDGDEVVGTNQSVTALENAPRLRSRGEFSPGESTPATDINNVARAAESLAAAQRRGAHLEVLCLDSTRPLDDWERRELAVAEGRECQESTSSHIKHPATALVGKGLAAPSPRAQSRGVSQYGIHSPALRERIVVLTKCDATRRTNLTCAALETSSLNGQGITKLRDELRRRALAARHGGDVVVGTAVRSADSLRLADQSLQRARQVASAGQEELSAAEIRTALTELGKVVGAVYTEDVLDRVFSQFCVGK